jgi:Flp pilus assembly protein TadD
VLEASAWRDWQEVAEFADALWADAVSDAPDAIADAVARLRGDGDLAGSVCNLIRFVQDEIDFQDGGFGSGAGHFPSGSGTVLRQRMGDAKDKAILLTALLRQAGVEAWPFLVNPGWQDSITSMLPSWAVFNHVIVTFIVDGQRHFVDPSDGIQRGDLADWIPPSYGFGLEVRPGVTRLAAMPQRPEAQLTLTETFYLDRKHQGGFVEQVLHATRWLADDIRDAIAHEGKTAFLKAHMEALEQQFPALVPDKAGGDLTEDPASDAIEWRGRHSLPTWGPPGEAPPVDFRYGAHGLFLAVEMIEPPQERTIPWALRHPMRVRHVVHVRSKDIPRAKPETRRHRGPGFRYSCDVVSKQGEVTFSYLWETTASQVEAGEWPDYCRERSKAFTDAEAHVVTKSSSSNRAALFALLAFAIVAGIGGWGILRFHRSSPAVTAPEVAQAKPVAPESPQPAPAEPPKTESPPAKKPVDPEVQVALEAASRGDFASAEPVFEKQQAQYQESAAFQFMRAELALRLGQLDRAREALTRGRELDPSNVTGDLLGAVLLRAEGNLTDAKQLVSETTERHPADPRVLRELANTLGQSGDLKGAKDAWGQLLALTPGDPDALLHYSVLLWQNGEKEQADAMITKALAAQTAPNAAIEAAAGDYYTYTGRPVEAIERLEKAVILAPEDRARRFALTFGNLRLGRTAHAVELARSLAHEFPMDVRSWNALAIADASNGDQEGAEAAFREWLRIAPQDPIAAANFGFFLHQCGRSIEARDLLAESTVKFPGEGMVWLNYAVVLEALGDKESANAAKLKADGLLTHEQKESMIH